MGGGDDVAALCARYYYRHAWIICKHTEHFFPTFQGFLFFWRWCGGGEGGGEGREFMRYLGCHFQKSNISNWHWDDYNSERCPVARPDN